jgi:ribosomal protein S19
VFQKLKKNRTIVPKDVSTKFKIFTGKEIVYFKVFQSMVGNNSGEFFFKKKYSYFHKRFFIKDE